MRMDKDTMKAWMDMLPMLLMALIVFMAMYFSYQGVFVQAASGTVDAGSFGIARILSANFMLLLAILISIWMLPKKLAKLHREK